MSSILALDYGEKRIGLAIASMQARLAQPYRTLTNDSHLMAELKKVIAGEAIEQLVVGLPRGLEGQETAQTAQTRAFARQLAELDIPLIMIDEAVTSEQARSELDSRGKPYSKADVDALAATYVLEDYLKQTDGK